MSREDKVESSVKTRNDEVSEQTPNVFFNEGENLILLTAFSVMSFFTMQFLGLRMSNSCNSPASLPTNK